MNTKPYNKADYTVPFYDTFPQFLDGIVQTYGDRPALSWFSRRKEEFTLTYSQMVQYVRDLRRAWCARGWPPVSMWPLSAKTAPTGSYPFWPSSAAAP